jgi:hypothetical protein
MLIYRWCDSNKDFPSLDHDCYSNTIYEESLLKHAIALISEIKTSLLIFQELINLQRLFDALYFIYHLLQYSNICSFAIGFIYGF